MYEQCHQIFGLPPSTAPSLRPRQSGPPCSNGYHARQAQWLERSGIGSGLMCAGSCRSCICNTVRSRLCPIRRRRVVQISAKLPTTFIERWLEQSSHPFKQILHTGDTGQRHVDLIQADMWPCKCHFESSSVPRATLERWPCGRNACLCASVYSFLYQLSKVRVCRTQKSKYATMYYAGCGSNARKWTSSGPSNRTRRVQRRRYARVL